jgi:rhamnogalacturonyl hydrolase YesR
MAAQAMLESGDREMVYLMGKEAVLRQTSDGRLAVVYSGNGVTDPAASGEAVLEAYKISGEEELKKGADKMLDYLFNKAPKSKEGILYHVRNAPEIWSDSFYMGPPFIAAAGEYKEAMKQVEGLHRFLWSSKHQMYHHQWDDKKRKLKVPRFWGGGNGWAAAAFARLIRTLPDSMKPEKQKLIQYHKQLLEGCLEHMRNDGLFYNYVNEPDTFVEANLSQMLAYSIFRGIKQGWLSRSYLDSANKMRNAAHKKVDKHGYVTGVCGAPFFRSPGRSTEAQAFFLLMEAAYHDLVEH